MWNPKTDACDYCKECKYFLKECKHFLYECQGDVEPCLEFSPKVGSVYKIVEIEVTKEVTNNELLVLGRI